MFKFVACVLSASMSLMSLAATPTTPAQLKPGDSLPAIVAPTLSGHELNFATSADGRRAVLIFSFSRAAGDEAQKWARGLAADHPEVNVYNVTFLESVPRLVRPMVIGAIRRGMPETMHDRTFLLTRDEDLWKQRLQTTNDRYACVVLVSADHRVEWSTPGPFSDTYSQLKERLQTGP